MKSSAEGKQIAVLLLAWLSLAFPQSIGQGADAAGSSLREAFVHPTPALRSRPLFFWNGPLSVEKTRQILDACKESGYAGVGILPAQGMQPAFMTPEFLDQYQAAVEHASRIGLKLCLYDEYWFPSGSAGGLLAKKYPDALSKRLDMASYDCLGLDEIKQQLPTGTLMAVVALNTKTKQRLDLAKYVTNGTLQWKVPRGTWTVLAFICVRDGGDGLVDYLNPNAVSRFISLTYQAYYDKFPQHFGTIIDSAFYDEPAFYHVQGGRAWTDQFNEWFQSENGYDPTLLYPALWMDIGPETSAARNALFGFRAELYARGFVRTINDWCRAHQIRLTGHVDQEEIANPVIGLCGDLMRAFKYQDIPGIDQIFQYGRASRAYKIVSSAAFNYDRPLVMTECFGAIDNMPVVNLYKETMDQFAKGINLMVPHAVWYEPAKIIFKPDLSPKSPVYGSELPVFNDYIARLERLLQGGRHVADIGVVYPIATLQAGSWFGPGKPYEGCVEIPEADYMQIGEMLSLNLRRDFTFIHPDVLERRCSVERGQVHLNNLTNHEHFRVLILPGSHSVSLATLRQMKRMVDQGGAVIGTTVLPDASAEQDGNNLVDELVSRIFGDQDEIARSSEPIVRYQTKSGGRSWFIRKPTPETLQTALDEALPDPDVTIEGPKDLPNGNLSYIHKVLQNHDIYFLANSSAQSIDLSIRLRGIHSLEIWDPKNGAVFPLLSDSVQGNGTALTRTRLTLPATRSYFLVSP